MHAHQIGNHRYDRPACPCFIPVGAHGANRQRMYHDDQVGIKVLDYFMDPAPGKTIEKIGGNVHKTGTVRQTEQKIVKPNVPGGKESI